MRQPQLKEIQDAYNRIFRSGATLDQLRDRIVADRLFAASAYEDGVPGRSMAWKLFMFPGPPLSTPASAARLLTELRTLRREYVQLLSEKMRAPDGGYEEGFTLPGPGQNQPIKRAAPGNAQFGWETNNPLSLDEQNPWRDWFAALELRKTIAQDVERTFPEMDYFRSERVQATLTNILFVQSLTAPDIGYRQGMHELLAPILQAVHFDSLSEEHASSSSQAPTELAELCDSAWAEADAWALFRVVMSRVSLWYEWKDAGPQTTFTPQGALEIRPHVAPIVKVCGRIHNELVRSVDPELYNALQRGGVEPQIYGIRWLRLLFTRESSIQDAMRLWDGLFAYAEDLFDVAQWVCVAMLIRIRNELIPGDYTMQLTRLLRYPASPTPTSPTSPTSASPMASHTLVLFRQASSLRASPTPATGATIVSENWNLFGIPNHVPETSSPRQRRRQGSLSGGISLPTTKEGRPSVIQKAPTSPQLDRRDASYVGGLPEMIATRLLDTGESLGINRYLFSTVSQIRSNLPDISGTLGRTAYGPSSSSADLNTFSSTAIPDFSQIQQQHKPPVAPLATSSSDRPPWEPRTRFEMEKEVTEVRALQKSLGQSVGWALDVLLADETKAATAGHSETPKVRREALEALSYVRDILVAASAGSIEKVDEERLFGEEEMAKRRLFQQQQEHEKQRQKQQEEAAKQPELPVPVPAPEPSRPPMAATGRPHLSSRDFRGPTPTLPRSSYQPSVPPTTATSPKPYPTVVHSFPPSRKTASPVVRQQQLNEDSPPRTTNVPAPWMHTKSNFSAAAPGVSPPTSVARLPTAAAAASNPWQNARSTYDGGYPPRPPSPPTHDPLGALQ